MEHKAAACRKCKAPIYFVRTPKGRMMPVDASGFEAQKDDPTIVMVRLDGRTQKGVLKGEVGWISHFATCPAGEAFRRRKRSSVTWDEANTPNENPPEDSGPLPGFPF